MLERVRKTIEENALLKTGDSVICAVSGGADSVCLLHTMLRLKSDYNLTIYVANVNHMIRGEESDEDSEFVRLIARAADAEFFYREYDVIKIARERKLGEEECGRILRYEFFEELSKKLGGAKIATAHNLNDNAETVLFRLARGTAAQGLGGIMYKRDNIIRPLLDIPREDIEKYLRSNSLTWREDSTNKIPVYARNKIRLNIMPFLNEISQGAEKKIVSAAHYIAEDNAFIGALAQEIMKECFINERLLIKPLSDKPMPILRRVFATVLKEWKASEVNAEKIERFGSFAEGENGRIFDINSECYAQKSYDAVVLCKRGERTEFNLILDKENAAVGEDWIITAEYKEFPAVRNGNNTAVFDADKLKLPLTVRCRKEGDRISLKGFGGTKKLSDIFTDEKIERHLRDTIPIVEKDGEILFVCGIRQSSLYEAKENTKNYLIIKYERKS